MMLETAKQYLECNGTVKTIDYLNGQTDADTIMTVYKELVKYTYWELKTLDVTIQIAEAGIEWCLNYADKASEHSESVKARKNARVLSYNLGSFCWVGWDEPGINITDVALKVGVHAAEKNFELVKQLQLGDLPIARALWLLAAHKLTSQTYTEAAQMFEESGSLLGFAETTTERQMTEAFVLLAKILNQS